jgi:hypothetical protein
MDTPQGFSPEQSFFPQYIISGPLPANVLSHFRVPRSVTKVTCFSSVASRPISSGYSNTDDETVEVNTPAPSFIISPIAVSMPHPLLPPTPEHTPFSENTPEGDDIVMEDNITNDTDRTIEEHHPPCEFSAGPCVTGNRNPRKCISHFFGRNKSCTRAFPDWVWVWYCRKHYQRARYRAESWPFTQCDIFQETLNRMEDWGGVASFTLILRKREDIRTPTDTTTEMPVSASGCSSSRLDSAASGLASTSPNVSTRSRRAAAAAAAATTSEGSSSSGPAPGPSPRKKSAKTSAPVPGWLRNELGSNKSFDEVRELIERIREHIHGEQEQSTDGNNRRKINILFPDIEILPTFHRAVVDDAKDENSSNDSYNGDDSTAGSRRQKRSLKKKTTRSVSRRQKCSSTSKNTRVSGKGGVKKIGAGNTKTKTKTKSKS